MPTEIISQYKSLEEIQSRKEFLRQDIRKDSEKMTALTHSLFTRPVALKKNATPAQRIQSLVSSSAGLLDGVILGWKLYRKFRKPKR